MSPAGGRTIQSVDRALDVLEVLGEAGVELPLKEIASRTGLNTSTCHHLLATLARRGYVGQTRRGRLYFIGTKVLELSSSRLRQFNLIDIVMPELRRLNQELGENVHLTVMQGHDLATLVHLDSIHPIRVRAAGIGEASAAHATARGKAILAWLPESEIERVVAEKGLRRFTEHTIARVEDLMVVLEQVRKLGYAVDREEFQPGITCVAAAIRNHHGAVIASVGCSMPGMRATDAALDKASAAVRTCASTLSQMLGSGEKVVQGSTLDDLTYTI